MDFRNADLVAVRGIRRLASILNLWGVTIDQLASCRVRRIRERQSVAASEGGSGVTFATLGNRNGKLVWGPTKFWPIVDGVGAGTAVQ